MRMKAIISYNGTRYYGYQVQTKTNVMTIQEIIQDILKRIFSKKIIIHSSGRTDRGVHALGQVIHFDIDNENVDIGKLRWSINSMLPNDIRFLSLEKVSDDFHSRYSAKGKTYRYIVSYKQHNPVVDDLVYNYPREFDFIKIEEAMKLFVGEHDFFNFSSNNIGDSIRIIESFTISFVDGYMIFNIKGNGFRRYMVRMIIGTCLEAGLNKISLEDIEMMLSRTKDIRTRFKAPPCGLYLVEVEY